MQLRTVPQDFVFPFYRVNIQKRSCFFKGYQLPRPLLTMAPVFLQSLDLYENSTRIAQLARNQNLVDLLGQRDQL